MLIDAHCHLERATYGDELGEILLRAELAGVAAFIAVGATRVLLGAEEATSLAATHPRIFATCGVHPHEAALAHAHELDTLERLLDRPKVVALGEIGLDYHYDHSPRDIQRRVFVHQLRRARERNLPVMLHVREAHADTLAVLDEVGLPARGGIVHCFTGGPQEAADYLARGLFLSIPGVVTFKSAEPLREAARLAPANRLLLETDSPYLAPVPHRGKRNEPAFVRHTAEELARVRGEEVEALARTTSDNVISLLALGTLAPPATRIR